jgi:hypothetical protein
MILELFVAFLGTGFGDMNQWVAILTLMQFLLGKLGFNWVIISSSPCCLNWV